jgi:5-methylcytosine-specific restriction protein A
MTYREKLASLKPKGVWIFTKQATDFDNAYRAAELFADMPENVNVERYFKDNCRRYDISTDRHRVLAISQFYGLITKTRFYARGVKYAKERTTQIFDSLRQCAIGSEEYNRIKSEQLLKVKIRAIIDTENNYNWSVLPIPYSFRVLSELKDRHGITEVELDKFYTYVMTCSDFSELSDSIRFIAENAPPTSRELVDGYEDDSRILNMFENVKLFNITKTHISVNPVFGDYFSANFIESYDIEELNAQLDNPADYTSFLTTLQDFGVNLIDEPPSTAAPYTIISKSTRTISDEEYIKKVDNISILNINEEIAVGAYKREPTSTKTTLAGRYGKNPLLGKIAIKNADYKCEYDCSHTTFISSASNMPYMEAHHLIPVSATSDIWNRFAVNVDCVENIVSLCPNCHRAIHYAVEEQKKVHLLALYEKRAELLKKIGAELSLEELLALYEVAYRSG